MVRKVAVSVIDSRSRESVPVEMGGAAATRGPRTAATGWSGGGHASPAGQGDGERRWEDRHVRSVHRRVVFHTGFGDINLASDARCSVVSNLFGDGFAAAVEVGGLIAREGVALTPRGV